MIDKKKALEDFFEWLALESKILLLLTDATSGLYLFYKQQQKEMLKVQSKREGSSKTPNKIELKSAKSPRNKPAAPKTMSMRWLSGLIR